MSPVVLERTTSRRKADDEVGVNKQRGEGDEERARRDGGLHWLHETPQRRDKPYGRLLTTSGRRGRNKRRSKSIKSRVLSLLLSFRRDGAE
jgi:hypothetical protein